MLAVPIELDTVTVRLYEHVVPERRQHNSAKKHIARINRTKAWLNNVVSSHRKGRYQDTEKMVPYILKHLDMVVEGHSVIQFLNHVRNNSPELPRTSEIITQLLLCVLDLADQGIVKLTPNKQYFGISIASDQKIILSDTEIDSAWKVIKPHIRQHALHHNTCRNIVLSHVTRDIDVANSYISAFVSRGLI